MALSPEIYALLLQLQGQQEPTGAGLYPEQLDRIMRSDQRLNVTGAGQDQRMLAPPRGAEAIREWRAAMEREMNANRAAGELSRYVNPATGQPHRQTIGGQTQYPPPPFGAPAWMNPRR